MSRLRRLAGLRLASDASYATFVQMMCFVLGPVLLIVATWTVARLASTPGEVVAGLLGAGNLAFVVIMMGMIVPLTSRREAPGKE